MRYFEVENPSVFEVIGQDAERYLNARLTQNIKQLKVGGAALAAALTPQGKTQGIFFVLRLEEQRFLAVADKGDSGTLLTAIKRYMVADRVTVTDHSLEYRLIHVLPGEDINAFQKLFGLTEGNVQTIGHGVISLRDRGLGMGYEVLIQKNSSSALVEFLKARKYYQCTKSDITYSRIVAHLPAYPDELNENSLFSEAQFHQALANNKGCYVGQEVVERAEAVGKTARVLQMVELNGCQPISDGAELKNSDGVVIGSVLTHGWNAQTNKTVCFARIKNDKGLSGSTVTIGDVEGVVQWAD